ncbi:MAG: peptidase M19 [Deltaproteobacteria bacterium]|nr:MAG: peptidase M19 [Deltaproteobacteria bacterium]
MKKVLIGVSVVLVMFIVWFFIYLPYSSDRKWNYGYAKPPYKVSPQAAALHKTLFIADMHNDSLMWNRDLVKKNSFGYIDLPRMQEGNIALQNFMSVTKSPRGQNIDRNDGSTDNITILAIAELWPVPSWFSLKERALYHARKLHDFAERSNGKLYVIKTADDLAKFRERRLKEPDIVGGVLGIEGTQVLEGDPKNIEAIFDAGYRVIGLTHFFDNEMAGSMHGMQKGGLTEKGKEMLRLAEQRQMIIDIAHSSAKTIDDILALSTRPMIISHTGVKGTVNNNRNLSDDQLRRIAAKGGLIGIGFWEEAIGPITDLKAAVRAILYAVKVAGVDNIALGSDSDGSVPMPFEISGMVLLTEALMKEGFSETEIRKIMGENQAAFYKKMLPEY